MSWKISIEEACREAECAEPKLREWLGLGKIPALMPGKAWVIPRGSFYEALEKIAKEEAASRARAAAPVPVGVPREKAPRRGPIPTAGWR